MKRYIDKEVDEINLSLLCVCLCGCISPSVSKYVRTYVLVRVGVREGPLYSAPSPFRSLSHFSSYIYMDIHESKVIDKSL